MDFISYLEEALGIEANKDMQPMQPGDVYATYANTDCLNNAVGFKPCTSLRDGLGRFVEWYKRYNGL